jgi:hypothetical protein
MRSPPSVEFLTIRENRILAAQIIYFLDGCLPIKNGLSANGLGRQETTNKGNRIMKKDSHRKQVATAGLRIEGEIRQRAYELFEARGGQDGYELEDWLHAEEEITGRKSDAAAA